MEAVRITARDVQRMVSHWLHTPVNGYLGSGYGSDVKSLLHTPMAAGLADGLIAKCREDIPMLQAAPPDMVNIYEFDGDLDRKVIRFDVAGELLDMDGVQAWTRPEGVLVPSSPLLIDGVSEASANALHTLLHITQPSPGYW